MTIVIIALIIIQLIQFVIIQIHITITIIAIVILDKKLKTDIQNERGQTDLIHDKHIFCFLQLLKIPFTPPEKHINTQSFFFVTKNLDGLPKPTIFAADKTSCI